MGALSDALELLCEEDHEARFNPLHAESFAIACCPEPSASVAGVPELYRKVFHTLQTTSNAAQNALKHSPYPLLKFLFLAVDGHTFSITFDHFRHRWIMDEARTPGKV